MAAFTSSHVKVGPGTLYIASLGSTEPTSTTAAWPSAWTALGYTDTGSEFAFTPTVQPVEVEETYWPVRQSITTYSATVTFALAERTAQSFLFAVNGGLSGSAATGTTGTNADSSIWIEPPDVGQELRMMIGWDALPTAGTAGDAFGRMICRQCLQTGSLREMHRKGNNKSTFACVFTLEKPSSAEAFRMIFPAALAA